jgi:hypothetical protein
VERGLRRSASAQPENDLLEPSALDAAAPLLTDAPISVDGAEDASSQTVGISLAAVFVAAPPIVA